MLKGWVGGWIEGWMDRWVVKPVKGLLTAIKNCLNCWEKYVYQLVKDPPKGVPTFKITIFLLFIFI